MLDAVSCWYFDWATVGTWVGGLGSAFAAGVAIWIVRQAASNRRDFASFLVERDIEKFEKLSELLSNIAQLLRDWEHPNGEEHELIKVALQRARRDLVANAKQFEYFGNRSQQFEYLPQCEEFKALFQSHTNLQELDDSISAIWYAANIYHAADEVEVAKSNLDTTLKKWKDVKHKHKPKKGWLEC